MTQFIVSDTCPNDSKRLPVFEIEDGWRLVNVGSLSLMTRSQPFIPLVGLAPTVSAIMLIVIVLPKVVGAEVLLGEK